MMNLCKLLEGREGEEFWCPLVGQIVELVLSKNNVILIRYTNYEEKDKSPSRKILSLHSGGEYYFGGECQLFPSPTKKDWEKWADDRGLINYSTLFEEARMTAREIELDTYGEAESYMWRVVRKIIEKAVSILRENPKVIEFNGLSDEVKTLQLNDEDGEIGWSDGVENFGSIFGCKGDSKLLSEEEQLQVTSYLAKWINDKN